jgi:hypothetical protein
MANSRASNPCWRTRSSSVSRVRSAAMASPCWTSTTIATLPAPTRLSVTMHANMYVHHHMHAHLSRTLVWPAAEQSTLRNGAWGRKATCNAGNRSVCAHAYEDSRNPHLGQPLLQCSQGQRLHRGRPRIAIRAKANARPQKVDTKRRADLPRPTPWSAPAYPHKPRAPAYLVCSGSSNTSTRVAGAGLAV